jgi:hypothetical protein
MGQTNPSFPIFAVVKSVFKPNRPIINKPTLIITAMKKIEKVLALFLIVGTATLVLQGCGSCNRNSSGNSDHEFNFLKIEENAIVDGEEVLKCYFKAEFPELKGHEIRICLTVTDSKGEPYTYEDDEGFPVPIRDTKWYENGIITDEWMCIPNAELELLPSGHKYYACFDAWDLTTNESLGDTKLLSFKR